MKLQESERSDMAAMSVVVPTYRRTESLQACLCALRSQTISDHLEIILIDQNADGYLEDHIDRALLDWCRVEKLNVANVSAARNMGGQLASHQVILFIDDDLEPSPSFCIRGLEAMMTRQNIDCLVPLVVNDSGVRHNLASEPDKDAADVIPITNAMSAAFFIKKDIFNKVGGFDPVLFDLVRSTEDKDFFSRLSEMAYGLYLNKGLEIYHREEMSGGCALRENGYWENRMNFIRGWIYMAYKRNDWRSPGISDWWRIIRSAFINREALGSGPFYMIRNIRLIFEGHQFVRSNLDRILLAHSRSNDR